MIWGWANSGLPLILPVTKSCVWFKQIGRVPRVAKPLRALLVFPFDSWTNVSPPYPGNLQWASRPQIPSCPHWPVAFIHFTTLSHSIDVHLLFAFLIWIQTLLETEKSSDNRNDPKIGMVHYLFGKTVTCLSEWPMLPSFMIGSWLQERQTLISNVVLLCPLKPVHYL